MQPTIAFDPIMNAAEHPTGTRQAGRKHKAHAMNEPTQSNVTISHWNASRRVRVIASSESQGWTGGRFVIDEQRASLDTIRVPNVTDDVLGFLLKGSARAQLHAVDGIKVNRVVGTQAVHLVPRNSEIAGRWDAGWTAANLWFNPVFFEQVAAAVGRGDPQQTRLLPNFYFSDDLLFRIGRELCTELIQGNPCGPLYADSLICTLALILLRHYSTARLLPDTTGSALTADQLRTIDDYIYAHLDQKISLTALAACVNLSVPHFERKFRAATHRPPYRYVLDIRLEKARALLATTRLTLAEAGLLCGFASQSHFTAHFSRQFGVSPARYMRAARA
jgi:AraC family transcriptional regulator